VIYCVVRTCAGARVWHCHTTHQQHSTHCRTASLQQLWSTVPRRRIADLLARSPNPEADADGISAILREHAMAVKGVYRSYGAGGGLAMDANEFWRFVKARDVPPPSVSVFSLRAMPIGPPCCHLI
jgi:hypothetical protein